MKTELTREQRQQAVLDNFFAKHPEMRTESSYRAYLLTRYPALPETDADLPQNQNHKEKQC